MPESPRNVSALTTTGDVQQETQKVKKLTEDWNAYIPVFKRHYSRLVRMVNLAYTIRDGGYIASLVSLVEMFIHQVQTRHLAVFAMTLGSVELVVHTQGMLLSIPGQVDTIRHDLNKFQERLLNTQKEFNDRANRNWANQSHEAVEEETELKNAIRELEETVKKLEELAGVAHSIVLGTQTHTTQELSLGQQRRYKISERAVKRHMTEAGMLLKHEWQ